MRRSFQCATFLASVLPLAGALTAHAGYRDLLGDWEGYEAPAAVAPVPVSPRAAPRVAKHDGLRAELARVAEARAGWEAALSAPDPRLSFFVPHAERVQRLAPLAADPETAAAALGEAFPLEDLEVLALLRNPGAGAREREFRASLEAFGQVASLEALLRQYAVLTAGLMTGAGAMGDAESPALTFPFPGLAALKGQIAAGQAAAAWEALEAARRDAVTGVRRAAWELGYLDRAGALTVEMLDLLGLPPGTRVGTPVLPEHRAPAPALEALYPLARERRRADAGRAWADMEAAVGAARMTDGG